MLQLFRNFFSSKIGIVVTLAFLGLIALAFASSDVANTGTFGGVSGGDRVAIVGGEKISTADLSTAVSNEFNQARQSDPTLTMDSFIASGGLTAALERLLDRTAIAEFGRKYGLRAGDRLIDSELLQIPAFTGPDGEFDEDIYRAALAQQGLSDAIVREDLGAGLLARQVMLPVMTNGMLPNSLVKRYAALLRESRKGTIGLMLSDAYAPKQAPSGAVLRAYYEENRAPYVLPERRVVRYATFDEAALGTLAAPTDAEVAARYQRDAAVYAASETRRISQLVVPTEAAANAVRDELSGGKSLTVAAREKGLAVSRVGPISQADLASEASAAVAQAVFAAEEGSLASIARGRLGFYVIRVEDVQRTAQRSLAEVADEIRQTLTTEKRTAALSDLSARVEDQLDDGASLSDVAADLGLDIETTPEVLANGNLFGKPGETAPPILARALSTAFAMEEGEPQLAELVPGVTFLIFDVGEIVPAAAPPLADVREELVSAWKRSEGSARAKEAADRVMKRMAEGDSIQAAMAKEEVDLPPHDNIDMNREQLSSLGGRVPPVLALMFSMAEGTIKRLEAPQDNGWFVVELEDIETGTLADDDPLIAQVSNQLGQVVSEEYARQFARAIQAEVGVERNQVAIDAVEAQLTGRN